MKRRVIRSAALLGLLLALPVPAHALSPSDVNGHFGFGFSRLFISHAPGGSLSVGGGLSIPMHGYGLGADVGLHLLGTRTVTRGSEIASVDYSLFEAGLFVRYTPARFPLANLAAGPEVMSARAELSTSGGGAAFQDLAVEKVVPGFGAEVTILPRRPSPVRVGLELGTRVAFVPGDTWTIAEVRLAFHY